MTGASSSDARREELVAQLSAAALGAMDLFVSIWVTGSVFIVPWLTMVL